MSADNYYFVRKRNDGKFDVTHRFASVYYADEVTPETKQDVWLEGNAEGWRIRGQDKIYPDLESAENAVPAIPADWIETVPPAEKSFDTLEEAIIFAHKCVEEDYVVEYGVVVQNGLLDLLQSS